MNQSYCLRISLVRIKFYLDIIFSRSRLPRCCFLYCYNFAFFNLVLFLLTWSALNTTTSFYYLVNFGSHIVQIYQKNIFTQFFSPSIAWKGSKLIFDIVTIVVEPSAVKSLDGEFNMKLLTVKLFSKLWFSFD